MGVFSLGWFDALLPAVGLFGGGADIPAEESVGSVELAAAAAGQVAETAVFEDPDALFPVCQSLDFAASRKPLVANQVGFPPALWCLSLAFARACSLTPGRGGASGRSAPRCCGCLGSFDRGGGGGCRGTVWTWNDVGRRCANTSSAPRFLSVSVAAFHKASSTTPILSVCASLLHC